LVVEDEPAQRDALTRYLQHFGYAVEAFADAEGALARLRARGADLLLTDLHLPGMDGLALLRAAHALDEDLGLLLVTAFASIESAIEALRAGAHDYLIKPLILEDVRRKVEHLLAHRRLLRENAHLRRALASDNTPTASLPAVASPAMQRVHALIQRVARARATVLVTGETGTGKEVTARAIHALSADADQPFLPINLAAIPEGMIAAELFGHARGAFTGAVKRRDGILRAAGRGVVFLDEIAEVPLPIQAQLLRALEAGEVQPLGSDRPVPVEARLIAATHRDLPAAVAAGTFREDLYFRLNVLHIALPPLRDRPEDIPDLTRALLTRLAARLRAPTPTVSPAAMRALCRYRFPGNVRELANILERALLLSDNHHIDLPQLPPLPSSPHTPPSDPARVEPSSASDDAPACAPIAPGLPLRDAVAAFERRYILDALARHNHHRERTARALGLSPATLYRRLEQWGRDDHSLPPAPSRPPSGDA
jgi:DNA-binding NtrC family response regulator